MSLSTTAKLVEGSHRLAGLN